MKVIPGRLVPITGSPPAQDADRASTPNDWGQRTNKSQRNGIDTSEQRGRLCESFDSLPVGGALSGPKPKLLTAASIPPPRRRAFFAPAAGRHSIDFGRLEFAASPSASRLPCAFPIVLELRRRRANSHDLRNSPSFFHSSSDRSTPRPACISGGAGIYGRAC